MENSVAITKITLRINPEDSAGVSIVEFYKRLARLIGYEFDVWHDCTKIIVSKNIQRNIFETMDTEDIGMIWVLCGPKTEQSLPDDTVELEHGFFQMGETPLPFILDCSMRD